MSKKCVSFFMAVLMCLSTIGITGTTAFAETYYEKEKLKIENPTGRDVILALGGTDSPADFMPDVVTWTKPGTTQKYFAYCVNPARTGYKDTNTYDIALMSFDEACKVDVGGSGGSGKSANTIIRDSGKTVSQVLFGAVSLGYPTKTPDDILGEGTGGTPAQREYAAYLATKLAIWSLIHNSYDVDLWKGSPSSSFPESLKQATVDAVHDIYDGAFTYEPATPVDVQVTKTEATRVGTTNNYESVYTIANALPDIYMSIEMKDNAAFPTGFKLCDLSGTELTKNGNEYALPANSTGFKAIYTSTISNFNFNADLVLHAPTGNKQLLYGEASDQEFQNYILAGNSYGDFPTTFEAGDQTGEKPKGKIEINKKDAAGNALNGAVFEFCDESGNPVTVKDFDNKSITTLTANGNKHTADNLKFGTYRVHEKSAPTGYELLSTIFTLVVSEQTPTQSIDVPNAGGDTPTGEGITIYKYSTETTQGGARIPLQGVVFELLDGQGRSFGTKATDASGTVNWSPLPLGSYHIYERTNNGMQYQLTPPTYQDVTLTKEQPAGTATFYDDTSTTVRPVKEDAQTGKPITGVEFELKQIDGNGNFVAVATTIADGSATFKDVPDGTYSVREVSTVDGYILDSTPQTVVVKNGQATLLKFLNSKYPNISILKQDAQTGETLSSPATFHVQQQNGSFSCDVKTGQTYTVNGATAGVAGTGAPGAANILNLPTGTYTITEKVAPAGYVLDPTPFDIHVVGGQSAQFIAKDLKCPTIQIQKLDSETGKAIPGVTFEVKQADGTMVGSFTTGTAGTVLVGLPTQSNGFLQPGTYIVTEKAVPPPYEIPTDGSQTQTVVVKAGDTNSVTFYDDKAPVWTIEKIDGQTGKPVTAPTTFHVKKAGGQDIGDFVTDSTGKVVITDQQGKFLPAGTYQVSEKIAPTGYTRTTDVYTVKLDGNKQITTVFENYVKPTITILKVDQLTGEPLEKAEFRLTERDDASRIINTGFTDKTGKWVTTDLEPGWYSVTELQPPKGYLLAEQPKQNIEIKAGESLTLKFDNMKMPQLIIQKKDAVTGKFLAGAEFEFKQTDGTSAKTYNYTTDSTGTITITDLPLGTYTVEETKAPKNYILNPQHQDVKLEGYDDKTLIFQDTLFPTLVITKTDYSTNKPVPNTTFKVEYENTTGGTELIGTYKTDTDGRIVLPFVKVGWYVLTESIPAQGMQLPSNPVTRIYLNPGTNSYTSTEQGNIGGISSYSVTSGLDYPVVAGIVNYPLNSVIIKKADANTGEMLSGATFELSKITGQISGQNGTVIGTFTTDSSGVIVVTGLEGGGYAVRETHAPQNYIIAETSLQTLNMKADGTSVIEIMFRNYPYGNILVTKVDGVTGEPLAGASFKVTDNSGAAVGNSTGEFITDSRGEFLVPNITPGSYVVTEIQAPANYAINTTPKTVQVGTDGKTYKISFDNYPYGAILISKVDALTGEPLAAAKFKVTDNAGKVVGNTTGEYTTDSKGEILVPNVAPGSYVITETQAPANYAINTTPKTVEVGADGKTYKVSYDNYPYGSLVIKKLDSDTKEPLAGAEFKVTTAKGDVVGTGNGSYTTDEKGTIIIPNLPKGSYVLKEIKAPTNYILENETKTIDIDYGKSFTLEFFNKKLSSAQIVKIDGRTKQPLKNAKFTVYKADGEIVDTYTTDGDGLIILPYLQPGWYKAVENKAPEGYLIDETPQDFQITGNQFLKLVFENQPMSSLIIKKFDKSTKEPLIGARFKITKKAGDVVGEYTSDANGIIQLDNLDPGWYSAVEVTAPTGYKLINQAQDFEVKHTKTVTLEFPNEKLTSLIIKKVDDKSGEPLAGAKFWIERQNGEHVGEFSTDKDGLINLPSLAPDFYVIRELKAPDGYWLDESPKTVEVKTEVPTLVTFTNKRMTGIHIKKVDEQSGAALSGAEFTVTKQNGERIGDTYTTDGSGFVNVPLLEPDYYIVTEIKAPENYLLDNTPKTVEVKTDAPTLVTFTNKYKSGLQIIKVDAATGTPLPGAKFTVYKKSGDIIGDYVTDKNGVIIIDSLENGWYKLAETKAPDGYMIVETPKDIEIKGNQFMKVVFENKKLAGLQIKKIDSITGAALPGAHFTVEKQNGEKIGEDYTTDAQGFISIPTLQPDWYVIRETKAPAGYIVNETPKTVQVKTDSPTVVTFENKALAGLKIVKLNSETKNPIEGVEFSIAKMNGEKVQNEFSGYTFVTDKTGQIYISDLPDGYYTVTETKAANGYFLDGKPKTVEIKSGNPTILEVLNVPASGLMIVKTDASTGKPLKGVVFDVRKADGQRVQSSILDENQPNTENNSSNKTTTANGDISGSYTTDATGRIQINTLDSGEYAVIETKALPGYELDTDVHTVTVTPGKQATLQLTNKPLAGLRLLKVDSITNAPIYNTEFMVFDANNKVVGTFYTDNNGVIDFSAILVEGRYTLRETRASEGYYRDDIPRTVEFIAGKMTEITWKNTPNMAQIQVTKLSADDNEVNGFEAGTPLANAIFEVYAYKSGNLVDRFISASNGKGVSKPLPLGRYVVKEVQAPAFYQLNSKELDVTLEFATQIVKLEFTNKSANTGVSIKKVGNVEAMPGDTIKYDIKLVRNDSTIPLTDFFWRDVLPVDAVRLNKIITGTYNQSVRYKIVATTNKGNTKIIADNLSTTVNNVIDCSSASLGLYNDEFVTTFTLIFGNVKAGFCTVEPPQVYVNVLSNLPNGYQFANKCDVGGKSGSEWVIGNSTWMTTLYRNTNNKLPKTGY